MSIQLLRWKAGSGGDTAMKILLDSDNDLRSQNRYSAEVTQQTFSDKEFARAFEYDQISRMSQSDSHLVDREILLQQMRMLDDQYPEDRWLLKTHCYWHFPYPVVDICCPLALLPFVVRANLAKNHRDIDRFQNYHPLVDKIKDPDVLYRFNCYNIAKDCVTSPVLDSTKISLASILGGWLDFRQVFTDLGFRVDDQLRPVFDAWLDKNKIFRPSKEYLACVDEEDYDHERTDMNMEERYCLLAIAGEKFRILK